MAKQTGHTRWFCVRCKRALDYKKDTVSALPRPLPTKPVPLDMMVTVTHDDCGGLVAPSSDLRIV